MPEYVPVALSKRAGEDALRERIPALEERGVGFVVVSGDMIEGTITATLLERANPGAIAVAPRVGRQALQRRRVRRRGRARRGRPGPGGQHAAGRRHRARSRGSERARRRHREARLGGSARHRARRLVRRLRDIAAGSRRQPRGRSAVARRPARRDAASAHARHGGRRSAAVAGRLADRLPARRSRKGKPQVHVVHSGGGEPVQATDTPLGVEAFDWSADGASLAYTARIPEKGRYGSVEGLDAAAEAPRHITGIRWHCERPRLRRPTARHSCSSSPAPDARRRAVLRAGCRCPAGRREAAEEEGRRRRGDRSSPRARRRGPTPSSAATRC